MLLLLCVATSFADEPPAQEQPQPQHTESAPQWIVLEPIAVSGNRPEPEIQLVLGRPNIPVPSTEQLLEEIDQRLAREEERP